MGDKPGRVLTAVAEGRVQIFLSEELLVELREVLRRRKFAARLALKELTPETALAKAQATARLVPASPIPAPPSLRDPDDLAVLACAVSAAVDRFSTGTPTNQLTNFYSTYNRTEVQERVRDLLAVCAAAGSNADPHGRRFREVILWGSGRAGLWALLAAPGAGTVVADCDQLDVASDEALLAPDLFCPGIRNIGAFEGVAMLAAPHPILLHNTGGAFATEALRATYQGIGASDKLRVAAARLPDDELVSWLSQVKR